MGEIIVFRLLTGNLETANKYVLYSMCVKTIEEEIEQV